MRQPTYPALSRMLLGVACCLVITRPCLARERATAGPAAVLQRGDTALARLNWSPVPTPPALPTASLLALASPRLSSGVTCRQLGGLKTHDGRLAGLGVLSPRIAPAVVLVRSPREPPGTSALCHRRGLPPGSGLDRDASGRRPTLAASEISVFPLGAVRPGEERTPVASRCGPPGCVTPPDDRPPGDPV